HPRTDWRARIDRPADADHEGIRREEVERGARGGEAEPPPELSDVPRAGRVRQTEPERDHGRGRRAGSTAAVAVRRLPVLDARTDDPARRDVPAAGLLGGAAGEGGAPVAGGAAVRLLR